MKFEKIFFILFSLLLLDACSDYVEKYESAYKDAYGDEAAFIDKLNNFEWEWSATCETGGWLWCAAKNGKVATSQIVSLTQFVNGSVGLVFTGKDNNAYDFATNTLPQDLTPLIRRNGGVAIKVENASGAFEAGVSVNLDGINLADIEKYKSIVIAYANEYPGAYISLREVVAGEVVSEWRWKLDKGDVSTRAFAFVDLEYVKGEADLPTFLAKANAAAFVLTENAEVTKGLTIVAVGFGNMGESYISIYPVSSASTPASSASVRVSSSSRPPNSSAAVYFNCDDPSSMNALDFARICAVSSSSARSSSSNATVRSSSSARSSSSIAASSSSARSSSSVVAPSSGVEQSSSSEGPSFLWRGIGNEGLANRYTVNMNLVPAENAGFWRFGDFGGKSDVIAPDESPIDTCNGFCGFIRFIESSGSENSVEIYFAVSINEHLYYDASPLQGLCITYYSDNEATLRIGPIGSQTTYGYQIPSFKLPAVTGTNEYMSYDIAWESFKQPSGAPKAISGAEAAEKLQFVDIMFKGNDGDFQFFNIYEIGSLGQCGKAENIKVSHVDADYFKDMAYQHAQELLTSTFTYGTYTDQRNQDYTRYYKTIEIAGNTWFAQNLNYNTEGSYCYDDKEENCYLYGRLYTWEAAQNACPTGWHLMTAEEFSSLLDAYESDATKLKSSKGWYYDKNGSDYLGFAVTPGGYYNGSDYSGKGKIAYLWNQENDGGIVVRAFYSDDDYVSGWLPEAVEGNYASVRCVKDKAKYENDIGVNDLIWYGGNKMNGESSYLTRGLLKEYPWDASNSSDYIQYGAEFTGVNITDKVINACGGAVCGTVGTVPSDDVAGVAFSVDDGVNVEEWGGVCLTYTSTASDGVVLYLETDDATLAKYYIELSKKTNAQSACNAWNNFKQDGKGVKQKLDSYLPKVNAIKIQFNSAASGAKFNIVSVGRYSAGNSSYQDFLNASRDNRTTAWDYLNPDITYTTITDDRDEQEYKTVVIGDQTWMAENLNYNASGSECNKNCNVYGRLYTQALAGTLDNENNLCPRGWRLPTYEDLDILVSKDHIADSSQVDDIEIKLKATSGWLDDGNGTNEYGFSAIAANGATETFLAKHKNSAGNGYVYNAYMSLSKTYTNVAWGGTIESTEGYPIRCIADETTGL